MNQIATFIKQKRKEAGLTQEEFAIRSGLGLRFVRELEQGKETVRMDKVNQALAMFGAVAIPGKLSVNEKAGKQAKGRGRQAAKKASPPPGGANAGRAGKAGASPPAGTGSPAANVKFTKNLDIFRAVWYN